MKRIIFVMVLFILLGVSQTWAQTYKNFPNMNGTNTNPYAYDKDVIYVTTFEVNQWIEKSVLATTGSESDRRWNSAMSSSWYNYYGLSAPTSTDSGTRIYIKDIPDRYLRNITGTIQKACLTYVGAQTFRMTNGSSQVFPVFQLVGFYNPQ